MNRAFDYRAATSFAEALGWLAEMGSNARPLAGGTDLLVNVRAGLMTPTCVIDLKPIPEITTLSFNEGEGLRIGAGVTINEIIESEVIQQQYSLLAICAHQLASHQVRNRATVVGNIVNASPCADMAPPLLCLQAEIEIQSHDGARWVPCATFFTGAKQTILKPGELVSCIRVPATMQGAKGGYKKLKRIQGHDLGIVGVALAALDDAVYIAVSSAAATPVLVKPFSRTDDLALVVATVCEAISPIDDVRCTKDYRLFMAETYVKRLWQEVVA